MSAAVTYPEHEKLRAVKDERAAVQEFIDWLDEAGYVICERSTNPADNLYWPARLSRADLIGKHFDIDAIRLDDEKRDMLDRLRALNSADEAGASR